MSEIHELGATYVSVKTSESTRPSVTTMGCCGDPVGPPEQGNRQVPSTNATVNQQPAPHPDPSHEKQGAHGQNGQLVQQQQQQSAWGQQPLPSAISQLHSFASTPPPVAPSPLTYGGSTNGYSSMSNQPLLRPSPVHASPQRTDTGSPHLSMTAPQMMSYAPQSPLDEGKMSVAIDFGR